MVSRLQYTDEVIELYTRNLYNVINQCYPNKLKKRIPVDNKVQLDMRVSNNPLDITDLPRLGGGITWLF